MNENDKQAEPVAWMLEYETDGYTEIEFNTGNQFSGGREGGVPLYTHPAQPVQPAGAQKSECKCRNESQECTEASNCRVLNLINQEPPTVAQGESDDSLMLCASDLEHSAIYDSHAEMQDCIRAVALRIKALGHPAPAAAINEQLLGALKEAKRQMDISGWALTKPDNFHKNLAYLGVVDAIAAAEAEKAKGGAA